MKVKRKCKRCGKTFFVIKSRIKTAKYCSMACYSMGIIERKCKNCGKKMNIKKHLSNKGLGIFCSRKCHYEYKHTIIKCKYCKKKFVVENNRINKFNVKYCSKKCQSKDAHIKRKCILCGKIFEKHKSDIRNTINCKKSKLNARFCSRKCNNIYRRKNGSKLIKCKRCGKQITKTNSQIKYGHKYCSVKCSNENGRKYPIEIRKKAIRERSVIAATFGSGEKTMLVKKTWAIKTALRKGILNKTILNHIKKGATYEAYI